MRKEVFVLLLFFLNLEAIAFNLDCIESPLNKNTFRCMDHQGVFTLTGVRNKKVLDKAIEMVPSLLHLPLPNQSMEMHELLKGMSDRIPYPLRNEWSLPAYTFLSMQNKGVDAIQGFPIDLLIEEADKIMWQDWANHFEMIKYDPNRYTGRYSALTGKVKYGRHDLIQRDRKDLQQWALHEVFGIVGIEDDNYKLSTLSILYNEGDIKLSTFIENQYLNLLDWNIQESLKPRFLQSDENGGITGVEGGGDIVTASIKRYMIIARQKKLGHDLKSEEISEIMAFEINYSDISLGLRWKDDFSFIPHEHLLTVLDEERPILILKEEIRSDWSYLPEAEKLKRADEYYQFVKIDFINTNLSYKKEESL